MNGNVFLFILRPGEQLLNSVFRGYAARETAFNITIGILETFIQYDSDMDESYRKYVDGNGIAEPELICFGKDIASGKTRKHYPKPAAPDKTAVAPPKPAEAKPEPEPYQEARAFPRLGMSLKLNRNDRNHILGLVNWGKIRDEITVPLMNDLEKGTIESRDSTNSFMYKATTPSEQLIINEALGNYLRKLGKMLVRPDGLRKEMRIISLIK